MKLNRRSLLKACEQILTRDDCKIYNRPIANNNQVAEAKFDVDDKTGAITNIRITLDVSKVAYVQGCLHETLHLVLYHIIGGKFNETLEESIISKLEESLWKDGMNKKDHLQWTRLIRAKLEE